MGAVNCEARGVKRQNYRLYLVVTATMAKTNVKRSKKQHTPDYYPVQRTIPVSGTVAANGGIITGTMVGDAGKLLSQTNRRLYRYGMNYRIKLDLEMSQATSGSVDVEVFALRNNWDVQRAFALAKATYDEAHADELNHTKSGNLARWRDFRMDDGVNSAVDLNPVIIDIPTLNVSIPSDGEFAKATVDDGGTEKFISWGNSAANTISARDEWIVAGRTGDDPSTVSTDAPYAGVNSDSMSDIEMETLGTDGNQPPYSATSDSDLFYRVGIMRYETAPDGLQRLSTGYFDAPCGLFVIKVTSGVNLSAGSVVLTAQSGDYKGISAQKMCQ